MPKENTRYGGPIWLFCYDRRSRELRKACQLLDEMGVPYNFERRSAEEADQEWWSSPKPRLVPVLISPGGGRFSGLEMITFFVNAWENGAFSGAV